MVLGHVDLVRVDILDNVALAVSTGEFKENKLEWEPLP